MSRVMTVGVGSIVLHEGRSYCVRRFTSVNEVVAEDVITGEKIQLAMSVIIRNAGERQAPSVPDLATIHEDDWQDALEKYKAILPLLEMWPRPAEKVLAVANECQVDLSTVYRWIKKFEKTRTIISLMRRRRADRGSQKLAPEVEAAIREVINNNFLKDQQLSYTIAHRDLALMCRAKNLKCPHINTFINRVHALNTEEVVRRRRGENEALKYRLVRGHLPGNDYPYSLIQIDHTKLDIILVDERDRIPVGRPYITLAIDTFSRMVIGFFISFDPPGTLGTGICVANTILPKDSLLEHYGLDYQWPCYGMPVKIQLDNAKEFRGNVLKDTCEFYGIDLRYRKVKKPQYGAYIERYLGTLLQEMHALPGTTFSNPDGKGVYDSEGKASMSIADLELWLLDLICGAYHNRPHSELGMSPLQKFEQGIMGTDDTPGIGRRPVAVDENRLRIDFLPMETRTIQPEGVNIDCITYSADVLNRWVSSKESDGKKSRKFIFRRDPRDISYLLFYDPDAESYYRIPYNDIRHPAMTLWEYRAVRSHLRAMGKDTVNEEEIFKAFERMKQTVDRSKVLKRQARIKHERSATAAKPAKPEKETTPKAAPQFKRGKIELFELEE